MEFTGLILIILFLDTKMESCEEEIAVLKRRLQASFVEVERQVIEMSIVDQVLNEKGILRLS